jgi:hypothetical protein
VPGYGSGFATAMGLETTGKISFPHTLADARFMYGAVQTRTIAVGDSDVEALVFRLADNTSAAVFQPRLHPFWLDKRAIELQGVPPSDVRAVSKLGDKLWPVGHPGPKGTYDNRTSTTVTWCLMYDTERKLEGGPGGNGITYLHGVNMGAEQLASLITSNARVVDGSMATAGLACGGTPGGV